MIVLANHQRRAAHGHHSCIWCREHIDTNERYLDLRIADGGTCWTQRQHNRCNDLVNRYSAYHAVDEDDHIDWFEVLAWSRTEDAFLTETHEEQP